MKLSISVVTKKKQREMRLRLLDEGPRPRVRAFKPNFSTVGKCRFGLTDGGEDRYERSIQRTWCG